MKTPWADPRALRKDTRRTSVYFIASRPNILRTLGSIRMPSDRPSAASAVLISSIDRSFRFFTRRTAR
jgi:hypothetical protein